MQPEPSHNAYLDVIAGPANDALARAMELMGRTAGTGARSGATADLREAEDAMVDVRERAIAFSNALATVTVPTYMRGADGQLQDALHLIADGATRGAAASAEGNGQRLLEAAAEIEVGNRDVVMAAGRIVRWMDGAAKP